MAQNPAGEPEGGSGKVFLVLGLLGGLALGGGFGYYFFKNAAPMDEAATQHAKERKKKEPLQSVAFDHVAVPIYARSNNNARFLGNYFVDLVVQVRGDDNLITVRRSEIQLQHSFISAISRNDLMREDSPLELDVDKVGALLTTKANEVLGPGIVEQVLVKSSMRLAR